MRGLAMTNVDYRNFAIDCLRWAEETADASERQTFIGIARLWMNTALMIDEGAATLPDMSALSRELRAKFD
jgi:hypothetical protein